MTTTTGGATVIDDLANLPERITASAERLSGLTESANKERQQRDSLIVEFCDHAGGKPVEAARLAGVTPTQITRILAESSAD